jgi:hypothetical protein
LAISRIYRGMLFRLTAIQLKSLRRRASADNLA